MAVVYFFIMHNPAEPDFDFGLVKIGITDRDWAQRLAKLQTGNPYELRCVATIETPFAREVEHYLHRSHASLMQHLEWIRWPLHRVSALISAAREAAHRIDDSSPDSEAPRVIVSEGEHSHGRDDPEEP